MISFIVLTILTGCTIEIGEIESVDVSSTNDEVRNEPIGDAQFIFFDVGQGDSSLVLGPEGETILIDTGRHDDDRIMHLLQEEGIETIDLLVLTHPHADHIGNADDVINHYEPKEIWMSGDMHTSKTFERVLDAVLASDATYYEPRVGETHHLGSFTFEIVNPVELSGELNNGSIAFHLNYGDITVLYTGDAEKEAEQQMVEAGLLKKVDILKVGHHGSSTSSHPFFLEEIQPDIAIYSAGVDNEYGHPHDEVIERLTNIGADIYGTDKNGTVRVYTDGIHVEVVSER